jgi:hypothetical protein
VNYAEKVKIKKSKTNAGLTACFFCFCGTPTLDKFPEFDKHLAEALGDREKKN